MSTEPTDRQATSVRPPERTSEVLETDPEWEGGGLSVVVPTYNERTNVRRTVDRCRDALDDRPFEIVVVDDDSPDETWRVARDQYDDDDRVRVVRRQHDRGLATAVLRGFDEARHEYCVVIDADLQHPPELLPELADGFGDGADIVVGSRHVDGGGIDGWSVYRRVVSRTATLLTRATVPNARPIHDPLSGFFAVRRELLAGCEFAPTGYKILLELLAVCEHDRVVEVPYVFHERERGESKLSGQEYIEFLRHLYTLRRRSDC
ncbi:polyprenol monophosphomannose synthase [Halomarina oriensis]|uniref:Glycosyltransferase n=1 Tax=Halomarina oriensis TaxID=671145 RepID=A0A6B0GK77_9EURY|nr:polyprenol monophosphomannose synthase [Halomarina oriensis]MWG35336.1 glycosyltransferase [Halomarina oriensis]